MTNYFGSIFSANTTITELLIALGAATLLGFIVSLYYNYQNHSRNLGNSLVVLPAIITVIIMLVNGNIGAGLAVAGTFSLIKFRSAPGTARDLTCIFIDVAIGLACGMGYIAIAATLTILVTLLLFLLGIANYGAPKTNLRTLKITIPENLYSDTVFDDIFDKYLDRIELVSLRTASLGSMYKLEYSVLLKDNKQKEFIDELRIRNGNLDVLLGLPAEKGEL